MHREDLFTTGMLVSLVGVALGMLYTALGLVFSNGLGIFFGSQIAILGGISFSVLKTLAGERL